MALNQFSFPHLAPVLCLYLLVFFSGFLFPPCLFESLLSLPDSDSCRSQYVSSAARSRSHILRLFSSIFYSSQPPHCLVSELKPYTVQSHPYFTRRRCPFVSSNFLLSVLGHIEKTEEGEEEKGKPCECE